MFSEIVPASVSAADVASREPLAIVLSGGPKSVHVDGAPRLDPDVYDLGVPILGICYGAQLIAHQLGGVVGRSSRGEYGRALMTHTGESLVLPIDAPATHEVWMSHFDAITDVPDGFVATASTADAPVAAASPDPPDTIPVTPATTDGGTVVTNDFFPDERDVTECVGVLERPGCGSSSRGGWRQGAILGVLVVAIGFIGWRISKAVRR